MPQMTIAQAMQLALEHQQAGRLAPAEQLYRQVLAAQPAHADALHLLGLIAAQCNRFDAAADLILQAIAARPGVWGYHNHLGLVLLDLGKLDDAKQQIDRAIELSPRSAVARANLARLMEAMGRLDEAIASHRQAAALDPHSAEIFCNLGRSLQARGLTAEAIDACRRAIVLDPNMAEAHNNLAVALTDQGKLDEAIASSQQAIELQPALAQAHNTLGNALYLQRRFDQAIFACREAARLMPNLAGAHANLGAALVETRQLDEAAVACNRAIELDPSLASARNTLASVLWQQAKLPEAEAACREAIRLAPGFAGAHCNLSAILMNQGKYDEATIAAQRAMQLQPSLARAYDNLGHILLYQGRADQAMEYLRQAVELNPGDAQMHSSLVFASCYLPDEGGNETFAEAKGWANRHENPALRITSETGLRENLKLKIGYVSADLRNHPVARFLLPLLQNHDRNQFEIHCFSDVLRPDETTATLKASVDHWHDAARMSDDSLAEMIKREKIDILVDLAGHSARNRLLTFARQPAPIQIAWLGYPATTGMAAMDYRLTDAFADPIGLTDSQYTEQLIRLPSTAWCYQPQVDLPALTERMADAPITFGSFNNFAKVNESMLRLWAEIVRRVPGSRLVLKAAGLVSPSLSAHTRAVLVDAGVGPDRIDLRGWADSPAEHLAAYNQIDIALDTFPYHGTTTTCEALGMGLPVVALAGQTHRSRVGVSLLTQVGLAELVATDRQEYADLAVNLATDPRRLRELRRSLRDRMKRSPLMDAKTFARDVEDAYCKMAKCLW